MPTRRQDPANSCFRQDAFASSPEVERGILANLVATRCQRLVDKEEVAMIWWLQQISWRDGGLERFAQLLLTDNGDRIGTEGLLKLRASESRILNPKEVRALRSEMPDPNEFLLKGEQEMRPLLELIGGVERSDSWRGAEQHAADARPDGYSVAAFRKACSMSTETFVRELKRYLVDPASPSLRRGLWNFPGLWDALKARRRIELLAAEKRIVQTAVAKQVFEELDFALETRSFIVIEGREGIGKSEAASNWCDRNPGRAVFVRLESGSDETTLFRTIARKIGTACSYARNAVDMRARIQDALQPGHLMLVIDEAHFLWPQSGRFQGSVPKRIDWLRTALVDYSVPVALVSTPQYFSSQCDRFRRNGWNANQIQRRVVRIAELPETIKEVDAMDVARSHFPHVSSRSVKRVAGAALLTLGFLSTIEHLRKRVDFLQMRQPGADEGELLDAEIDSILSVAEAFLQKECRLPAKALRSQIASLPDRGESALKMGTDRIRQAGLSVQAGVP